MSPENYDAVVVGAGPNGLAAAIELARADLSVLVLEGHGEVGGGCRSAHLTEAGFVHDVCSAIHPLALASPFFKSLPLERLGARLVHPDAPLAHLISPEQAVMLERDIDATAQGLGPDGSAYVKLMRPLVRQEPRLVPLLLGPLRIPRHPLVLARFGIKGAPPASLLARRFAGEAAPALLAGIAAHSVLPLSRMPSAGVALLLGLLAHAVGWPMVQGGSQALAEAMRRYLLELGGEVRTSTHVGRLEDVPPARAVLFDTSARAMADIAGKALPSRYARWLRRFRHGPGLFKIDWALDQPIPWKDEQAKRAATVHVGGNFAEVAASEEAVWRGNVHTHPFVLLAQQSLFDPTRAPAGKHTAWAYAHVPAGWTGDGRALIEDRVERFAPGFRDLIRARHTFTPMEMEAYNPNYIGGDITGGVQDLLQTFIRPAPRMDPYATPNKRLYLCSSSTPPGGGVHGMCGYHAAHSALRRSFGRR